MKRKRKPAATPDDQVAEQSLRAYQEKRTPVIETPDGPCSLGELLGDLVKPYVDAGIEGRSQSLLYQMAGLAWNLALLPADLADQQLAPMARELGLSEDDKLAPLMVEMIRAMMEAKLAQFPEVRKLIARVDVYEEDGELRVSVIAPIDLPSF